MDRERTGFRDQSYSAWHRPESIQRFIGISEAQKLGVIDLDVVIWIEFNRRTRIPLVLVETAIDVGQAEKPSTVTQHLAAVFSKQRPIAAYCVLYTLARDRFCPDPDFPDILDIERFRVKRLEPHPEKTWRSLAPGEFAAELVRARDWAAKKIDREINGYDAVKPLMGLQSDLFLGNRP